jgi:MFS transporter, PAT family, solute carrier family 33 (acetyl-CoA transportor), member 1
MPPKERKRAKSRRKSGEKESQESSKKSSLNTRRREKSQSTRTKNTAEKQVGKEPTSAATRATKMDNRKKSAPPSDGGLSNMNTRDRQGVYLLFFLYILQGVPMGISAAIPMILQDKKVSMAAQGTFSFCSWPFSLKLLWAPIVDSVFLAKWGHRKSWLIPTQLIIGFVMLFTGDFVDSILDAKGDTDVVMITTIFFALFFLCATQDIAVDGWALTMLSKENVGYAATCNAAGQALGNMLSFVGFLALKDHLTLGTNMKIWGALFLVSTTIVAYFKKEETCHDIPELVTAYKEMALVCKLSSVQRLCMVLLTSKIAFAATEAISLIKLQEAGMPKQHIGYMATLVGVFAVIIPGFVKDYTAGKTPFQLFTKLYVPRLCLNALMVAVIYGSPKPWPETFTFGKIVFYVGLLLISLCQTVVSTAMFVGQVGLFAKISDPRIGGTYMTLLNTVANLAFKWPLSCSYFIIDLLTSKDADGQYIVDGFYPFVVVTTGIGLYWARSSAKTINQLEQAPLSFWKVPMTSGKKTPSATNEDEGLSLLPTGP